MFYGLGNPTPGAEAAASGFEISAVKGSKLETCVCVCIVVTSGAGGLGHE